MTPEEEERLGSKGLVRGLGPWAAASLVVGTIIGTGVFLKTAAMAQHGASAGWILAAWAAAGALSLFGAMTYAELGAMFPAAGGEYVYLRRGYGPLMGYLYAWLRFWIGTPGSIAAYAVGTSIFLRDATSQGAIDALGGKPVVAIGLIAVFTAITCLDVRSGGRLQAAMTALKVAMVAGLAAGALLTPRGDWGALGGGGAGFPGWSAFGAMVLAALWAYDGWNNLPMAAGEVRDPARNLPRAIVGGTLTVLAVYALVNLGYFHAVPMAEILTSAPNVDGAPSVAAKAATQFFGDLTVTLFAAAMAFSALSAMNGSMLTGARVPYAVATDGLAPRALARLSRARIPITAVLVQGALACVYAVGGGFDFLTDAVVFASWLFYALNAGSVLLLRRREPDRPRPFRVPGFPVVPLVYIALCALLLASAIYEKPVISALGLGTTALGALVYLVFYRGKR